MARFSELLLALVTCHAVAEINADVSSQGLEFVFSIPSYAWGGATRCDPRIILTTSVPETVNVNITVWAINIKEQATLTNADSVTVSLLSTACLPRGSGIQPQTVLVQSTRPISVHVFNADSAFGEGFLALPTARLGKTYYVTAFALTEQQSSYGSRPGFAALSATDVQTTVEVTPKGGDSYTVDLQPYETYMLETNNDPTGTRLSANKPVSVIAGLVCGSVPEGSTRCSFLIEQLPSVNQLGHYFIVGPFMGRPFGYVCRIVGVNQTLTNVNVSNSDSVIQLKAGEKHDIDISDDTVLEILSDKAVIVMQYMKYWDVTNDEDDYASMMVVPAVEFFSGNVKFPVFPIPTYYSYYTPRYSAHVVVKCEYASGLTFDGAPMTGELLRSDSGNMCILYKQVTPGVHGIEHVNATFSVVVSGTSYGYPAAFNLKKDAEEDDVVFARIGDTVILPCNKTMPTPAPSRTYSPYLLEWVRTDFSYLILRNSSSTPPYIDDRYKGRVSIVNDLALKIDDLRIDDSGWYKCQIINLNDLNDRTSSLNNENSSHLVVLEKSTTTPTPLEPTPTTTTQNPETSVDIGTQGQEFVFAIPRPDSDCNPRIILTTSAAETVNVDITISAINLRKEAIVNSADSVTVTVPSSGCLASGTGIKAGTVRVKSTRPISVHVFNTDASGGDGFLAFPMARLGRTYYVTAFRPKSGRPSFAAISATDVQTTVEVTPKGGDSYTVNLQPYETYQLEQNSDPTGTRLSANKPIAVVAGSVCATIPIGTDYFTDYSCGSILEQLPSVHQLGHNFVLGAYPGHRSGYICRIVGVNETVTDVKASNSDSVINLNAGEFVDIDVEFVTDPQTIEISSDKPVLVMQYMKYSINDRGDASMNLVPPIDLFTGKINFPVFKMAGEEAKYGVNVAAECRYGQSLIFDGGNVYSWDIERSGNSGSMCVSRREVTTGMHVMEPGMLTMEHKTAKFYIVVCGYRWDSSYCYPAAFNLNKAPLFEATPNSYSECYTEANGQDYRGQTSTTERGNICQKWTSQTPHSHDITTEYWPGTGIGDHNYCRNPSGGPRAWCYTIDPAVRREYCDIGQPSNTCDLSVREDGRCGPGYFAPNANEGECHPEGEGPCCSAYGWCGITDVHCVTSVYKDYRGNVIVGNVVKSRDRTVPGNFFVILPNDPIPGDGFVTGWRAYPTQQHTQGTFRALVLSPDPSGDDSIWTIVGVYDIPAASSTASDIYTYTIPTDQHIPVHKDYVIGVAYMENGGPQLDATSTSINTQNRYISISSPTELNVGDELTFNNLGNLEISFAAIVRLTDQAPTETVPTEVTSKVPEAGDTGQCYECLGQIGIPGFPDIEPNCFDPFNSAGIATPECVGKCFANYTSTSIFGSTFQRVQRGCITNPVECLPSAYCQDVPAPDGSGTSRYCSYCCDGGKCNSQGLEEAASGSTSCWNCQANITESMEVTPGSCSSDDFIGGTLPDVIPVPCQGMCVIANVPAGLLGESAQFLRTCDQFGLCAPGGPPPGFENVVFKCCEGDKCNVGGIDGDDAGVVITSTMKTGQPTAKAPTSEAPSTEVLEKRTNVGSQGLEFVFAIPSHDWGCTPRIILTTSAPETVNVNITISAININQATLNSTDSMTVNLLNTACLSKGSGIKQKTVVVKSTRPISVHVFNTDSFLGEGFLALPTAQLGRAYYVAAFSPTGTGPAFAAISATDVQTTVEVTPKAGDSYTVDLQPYETYMLETTYDPTGTRLSANKPISVVAGNSKMLEQLPSVDQLGQYFVVGPFVGRPFGYVCRIVGVNEKLTNVSISNSNSPIQLGAGDKYDVDITDETVLEISSDRPVLVMQYMKYTGLKDYEDDAASMVLVPAEEFFSGNVNFPVFPASTPTTSTPIYNIHVVAKCEYASSLTFNGAAMTGEILRSASGNMCILRKQVTTGMHGIEHVNATFYIVVYGSSYGYPAAFNLNRGVPSYGKLIGSFTTKAHGVTGKVYAATNKRLYITEFNYDGGAPDAFVWMGNTDTVGSTGEIIPVNGSSDVLSRYSNDVVQLDLAGSKTLADYKWVSIWCRTFRENFGDLYFSDVDVPSDQSTTIPTPPVPKPTPTTQDPECTGCTADVGWDLVTRTSSASANYIFIFPLKVIPWDGVVTEWSVKAKEAWPLFATVFRPVTSDGTFKIIGINQINSVIAQQVTTYTVPSSERIQVKQNDVIGFISLYPSTAVYSDNAADNLYYYARYTGSSTVGLVGATFESSGSSSSRFSIQAKVMKQCDDPISPQERSADIGSQGQEFVFAIPRPDSDCNPRIILTTSATETVSVDITISAINMWRQAAVTSTDSVTVTVPSSACLASGSGIQTGTVKVVATMPISVHVFNTDASGGDGFLAIPTEQLGTTYYIAAFTPTTGRPSFAVFTATDFQTTVEVTPKGGHSYRVTLQPYETYQLEANSDPTGTRLSANKPIAVVAGSVCAAIPVGGDPGGGPACDSILEQLPSVHQLGHNFVLGPYMGHRAGYICRIVGVNGTLTNVEVSGSYNIIQLNAGDFYDIDIEFVTDPQIIEISSDKPVLVMQYMKFSVNDRGDASMNLVPAVDFFAGNVNFPVFKVTESDTEYGVQVAVECKYAYSLIFDGAPMTVYDKALTVYQLRLPTTGWELLRSDSESMCMLRNEVTTGVHIMEHAEATFYIVVCGYSYKSSYCYPAAFNLNKGPLLVSTAAPGSYTECYTEAKGQDYRGHTSSTQGGKVCQKWTSQTPHDHSYTPENRPGTGIGDHNYCRNPGGDPKAWCYTIDPATRWDYCDIGKPSSSCDSQPITEAITSAAPTTTAPTTSAPTTTTAPTTSAPTTSGPTTSAPTTSAPSTLGSPGGFEYVFAIPEIYYAVAFPYVLITTTSLDPVHTSLSIPGFAYEVNNEVTRYKQASIRLSVADGIARIADPGMSSKTIIVRSTAPVTVHAFDNDYCCTDGFLVLPTSNLGTEYYIATYAPDSTRNPSFLTVSALDYKTEVDIVTKAGQKTHITLQAYMSYRFNGGDYEDLTNTYIRSERPVSVVTGVYTKTTREENASGMVVNIEPVSSWGKSFVLAPFKTKTCGYAYRVLSSNQSNQDTILTISNIGTVQLQAGDYYEGVVTRLKMITITSTLPILVVQYMKYSCNDRWNPAMFQVAPVDTFYNEVTFPVFSYDNRYTKNYFINVIIDCDYVDGLVFDNVVTNLDQLTTDDQSICAILAEISTGPHHVRTTYPEAKFTVSVYLMCSECSTSFAYRAGVTPTAITRLTIPPLATSETSYTGDITCHVCKVGGFEYVFAIPETYAASSKRLPNVLLTTSSLDSVSVTLTIPGLLFEVKSTITKNEPATITLPVTARVADSGKSSKTVIVSASAAVTVHAFDNDCCGDGFLAIPTSNLGIEYYVVAYVPNDIDYPSSFTVSALQHETSVYFATKTQPDYPLRVDLKPFESYRYVGGDYEDITSTYIRSDRPVSVISAAFTQLNIGYYPGGMLVNIQPVSRWGKKFVLAPFMTKTCGYLYRVQSINQDTILTISDIGTVDLQAGEYYEGDVTDETLTTIQSDLPVLVVQYLKDYHACNYNGLPSMMEVTPTESYYNNVTFPVFEVTVANPEKLNYFINVITNCNNVNGLRLNDTRPMVNWNRLTTRDGSMCALRSEITPGLYSVGNTDPSAKSSVSVYMMCKGTCVTSYTYQAGAVSAAPFATPAPTTPTTTQPMTTLETVVGPIGQVACKTCKAVEVFCNETAMTAVFKTSALPFKRPSDVHLWDPSCEASEYGRKQAILTTNYDMCNTTTQESRGYMVFKNALILGPDNPNSLNLPPQVTIECRVKSQQGAVTSSKLYYNLEIFQDATYGTPYGPEEYPVDVKVGDEVYVAGSVTTVPEQHLFIESCWATPTTDQYHEASYSLITNGCSNDLSLTRYNFADPNVELFSFKSFAFRNNWLVFIHCQMLVCDVSTPDSRCKQGCLMDSSTGSEPLLRRSNDNTHTVTSGPLVVRGKWCAHREC